MADGKENDYIDIRGNITAEKYYALLGIDNPIPFPVIATDLKKFEILEESFSRR
jgi:hypothetical protein